MLPLGEQQLTESYLIEFELFLKYVLVELILQFLVRKVDEQLLKRVLLEDLKPKNIQDAHLLRQKLLIQCLDMVVYAVRGMHSGTTGKKNTSSNITDAGLHFVKQLLAL